MTAIPFPKGWYPPVGSDQCPTLQSRQFQSASRGLLVRLAGPTGAQTKSVIASGRMDGHQQASAGLGGLPCSIHPGQLREIASWLEPGARPSSPGAPQIRALTPRVAGHQSSPSGPSVSGPLEQVTAVSGGRRRGGSQERGEGRDQGASPARVRVRPDGRPNALHWTSAGIGATVERSVMACNGLRADVFTSQAGSSRPPRASHATGRSDRTGRPDPGRESDQR
jgi:hypothetical protein